MTPRLTRARKREINIHSTENQEQESLSDDSGDAPDEVSTTLLKKAYLDDKKSKDIAEHKRTTLLKAQRRRRDGEKPEVYKIKNSKDHKLPQDLVDALAMKEDVDKPTDKVKRSKTSEPAVHRISGPNGVINRDGFDVVVVPEDPLAPMPLFSDSARPNGDSKRRRKGSQLSSYNIAAYSSASSFLRTQLYSSSEAKRTRVALLTDEHGRVAGASPGTPCASFSLDRRAAERAKKQAKRKRQRRNHKLRADDAAQRADEDECRIRKILRASV